MAPVEELTKAYANARADAAFRRELHHLLTTYAGRPTPLTEARRLSAELGARILLKRED
ncbi:MAG: tryptophan synthase subunit beta, partial [Thermoanaerobaculia bacterium]